ncbi:glycosyltransferase [Kutzneria viridogrisea]|uniref:Glycosyltransferase involved in cell wall biosynthesis n=1 Tax=Kutzneria viridogrisea TaxID=47990 RepID=A0ABR6B8P7_9PSEU|nr:glycosyltransferase involved in cell wall biosynthesis [Kutzneria viridogrisea]
MKLGVVSGDGLPVSGLLTVFRNVVDIGVRRGLVDTPVAADLGYSWRPDKGAFYPDGAPVAGYPDWLWVSTAPPAGADPERLRPLWREVRDQVADPSRLDGGELQALRGRIEELAEVYREHFRTWLDDHEIDWVVAINMTLSDAVPVTAGLQAAVRERFGDGGRPGGVLFWDHDLFGSCAIFENGLRIYPEVPNELIPVPQKNAYTEWVVVSSELAAEALRYPTDAKPSVVPNVLPVGVREPLGERHREFARHWRLDLSRPVVLCPVRVFRVKGVDLSLELLAATRRECARLGRPLPYLLVFGSLDEDPDYAAEITDLVARLDLAEDVRFLDGVPLGSYQDARGTWVLDEVDLLRLAAATEGMVFFTPSTPDVETIGLGPALASLAHLPCATTYYTAFEQVYGMDYRVLRAGRSASDMRAAGAQVARVLHDRQARYEAGGNGANVELLSSLFPEQPWLELLRNLHATLTRGAAPTDGGSR